MELNYDGIVDLKYRDVQYFAELSNKGKTFETAPNKLTASYAGGHLAGR